MEKEKVSKEHGDTQALKRATGGIKGIQVRGKGGLIILLEPAERLVRCVPALVVEILDGTLENELDKKE